MFIVVVSISLLFLTLPNRGRLNIGIYRHLWKYPVWHGANRETSWQQERRRARSRLWSAASGLPRQTIRGHISWVRSVTFSPDGKILASGNNDQTIRLWEVSSGKCLNIFYGQRVAFSPDGKILASDSNDGTIHFWDRQTGTCSRVLRSDRPYERMNILQVRGLTEGQKTILRLLGATEDEE